MNILVVSEVFLKGGLETHINTYYELLKENNNIIFAFGKFENNNYLKDAKIYTDFNFSYNSTIKDFCNDVEKLVKIIKENNIEIVHVHPFYSFFPALFAANLTNVKLIYTYHGYGSINFVSGHIDSLLFLYAINQRIDSIFCVADNVIEYFKELHGKNVTYLPNIIDEDIFYKHEISYNKKWALISRIDIDKYSSIIKFLEMFPKLNIDYVDIYGIGSKIEDLKQYIIKHKLSKKVKLKGFVSEISNILNNYTGTIGIGRVTTESLCMNYPSILIGYDKVVGVITDDIYEKVKKINFVPAALDDIDIDEFNKELNDINNKKEKKYQFRNKIIQDFGKNNVNIYINEIEKIKRSSTSEFNELYYLLKDISNKDADFYNSIDVYNIVCQTFGSKSRSLYFKIIINNFNYCNRILLNQQREFNNQLINIQNSINELSSNNNKLYNELKDYHKGKLYKISKKIYIIKSKIIKNKKKERANKLHEKS